MCSSSYHVASLGFYRELVTKETGAAPDVSQMRGAATGRAEPGFSPWRPSRADEDLRVVSSGPARRIAAGTIQFGDVHVASSCLQKALRRADEAVAFAAARYLLTTDEPRLWRRLVVCAFEDFGLCDLNVTARVVAMAGSKNLRLVLGQERVLATLIGQLCALPEDRRLDDLYVLGAGLFAAKRASLRDPTDDGAQQQACALMNEATRLIGRCEQPVPHRSFRSLSTSACERELTQMVREGLADAGLFELCLNGARLSRCLLPVLLPLAIAASEATGGLGDAAALALPAAPTLAGVPAYAFDGFTRTGRSILGNLAKHQAGLAPMLSGPSLGAGIDVLHHLLFFAEEARCNLLRSDGLRSTPRPLRWAPGCHSHKLTKRFFRWSDFFPGSMRCAAHSRAITTNRRTCHEHGSFASASSPLSHAARTA